MGDWDNRNTLGTLERGFEIVSVLMKKDGARVTEVAEALNIAPSTAHKYLVTLRNERFVVKEGDEYHVGMRFLTVGDYARRRKEAYEVTIGKIRPLAEQTGERVQFMIEEHGRAIYVATVVESPTAVRTNRHDGQLRYLHSCAAGKAILAFQPPEIVDEVVERWGLPTETEHTITDRARLDEELERIRTKGIAFNDEESIEGLRAVGVPIRQNDDTVVGAISVSGPAHRLKGSLYRSELPDAILGVVNEIELKIEYS